MFLATAVACSGGGGKASKTTTVSHLALSSSAFVDGGSIPPQFTCDRHEGELSLSWDRIVPGAVELALVMEDPDARGGTYVHWTLWGISPSRMVLDVGSPPPEAKEGANSSGPPGYISPCPPPGELHHYVFTLYALSRHIRLQTGASASQLTTAVKAAVVAEGRLTGTYTRGG